MSQCDPNEAIRVQTPDVLRSPLTKTVLLRLYILIPGQIPGQKRPNMDSFKHQTCIWTNMVCTCISSGSVMLKHCSELCFHAALLKTKLRQIM